MGWSPNGVKYGASLEVRQNSGGCQQCFRQQCWLAGSTLYWRRETGYVGTDKLGTLHFSQTDGVQGLFAVGTSRTSSTRVAGTAISRHISARPRR
jgi:hypothetical protein